MDERELVVDELDKLPELELGAGVKRAVVMEEEPDVVVEELAVSLVEMGISNEGNCGASGGAAFVV